MWCLWGEGLLGDLFQRSGMEARWSQAPCDRGGHEASLAPEIDILDRSQVRPGQVMTRRESNLNTISIVHSCATQPQPRNPPSSSPQCSHCRVGSGSLAEILLQMCKTLLRKLWNGLQDVLNREVDLGQVIRARHRKRVPPLHFERNLASSMVWSTLSIENRSFALVQQAVDDFA